jgi:peptidoglycan/LPS O-acetylase OafA/YrhL
VLHNNSQSSSALGWGQFDTVRLILAAIVVTAHAYYVFITPLGYVSFSPVAEWMARYAVLCFFVLSGLVIGRSLMLRRDGFVSFMIRRVGRIYPPLIFSIVLVIAIGHALRWAGIPMEPLASAGPMVNGFSYDLESMALSLATFGFRGWLSSEANAALWSLVIEMRCYVVAGLLAQTAFSNTYLGRACSAGALLCVVGLLLTDGRMDSVMAICYAAFALGVSLNWVVKQIPRVLPEVRIDISYSLYIVHQPIMLGLFFICYQPSFPSLGIAIGLGCAAMGVAVAMALFSARWIEPLRLQPLAKAWDRLMAGHRVTPNPAASGLS